jgi:hypothetical protein
MIFRETRDKRVLCPTYLDTIQDTALTYKLASSQLQDLCGEYGLLSQAELLRSGFNLSNLGYGRISNALNCFFDRLRPNPDDTENAKSMLSVFGTIKKNGRKCRKFLSEGRNDDISIIQRVKRFLDF